MADDELTGGYNPTQYGFFTAEGGQWVFRGETVDDVDAQLDDLLAILDDSESGPGLKSKLQRLKDSGILKEGKNPAQNAQGGGSGGSASQDSGDLPGWVLVSAATIAGRPVEAHEIKQGVAKTGRNVGKPWYKFGDTFVNQPRG